MCNVACTVLFEMRFDYVDMLALAMGSGLGAWYMYEKHWVANNIFGLAFSINGIEMLSLDNYQVRISIVRRPV